VGILLGGISLPGASSPETDGPGAVVVVVSCYLYGWSWATMLCTSRSGLLGPFSPTTAQQRTKSRSARTDEGPYGYQLAAMLCFLIFADNLLRRIDGHEEMMWFGVSVGKWELIFVSDVLCLVCHLLFLSRIAPAGNPRIR
jgi:hypothetical protein